MRMNLWNQHVADWKDCTRCDLHKGRKRVVLARGDIPCSVLFLGEAPGKSEDVLGQPFMGPAGKLLDKMIREADQGRFDSFEAYNESPSIKMAFTNLVACIPLDGDGDKAGEPDPTHITACRGRVASMVEMCQPKLIVCVGKLASKWLDKAVPHRDAKRLDIHHPAFILRMPVVQRSVEEQRTEVQLRDAFREIA